MKVKYGFWNDFNVCKEESLKYKTKTQFKKYSSGAFDSCVRNNWLDEICSHMILNQKPNGYWTKEKCQEEALKYQNKTDFDKYSCSAYDKSLKYKWLDEICYHMKQKGDKYKRCIYVYEFVDNFVYVGLTYNIDIRNKQHLFSNTTVGEYIIKTKQEPKLIQLTDYIDVEDAKILEGEFVEKYRNNGWNILNKAKTGSVGGCKIKWTKEKCQEEALKYESKYKFKTNCIGAFTRAKKENWLDEICSHMIKKQYCSGYWTKDRCLEKALKYDNIKDFRNDFSGAYSSSSKNGWLDDITYHMTRKQKPNGYWTKEKCLEEITKYDKISHFKRDSGAAYNSAKRNKWLDEISYHFKNKN